MPKKKKKTMAVHEMAELLGLKKTDSYWLIHKQKFQTITVNGKTRVVIESFEKWYANQVKYKKAGGPPPGEELRRNTYSPQEIAELLGIDDTTVYLLIQKDHIPTIKVDYWMRIPKSAFESWYASQSRYRTPEDRERDREVEEASMTMPEMAKELGIPRSEVYKILRKKTNKAIFQFVVIADRRRVMRDSFEKWYSGQNTYIKVKDRPLEEQQFLKLQQYANTEPRLEVNPDKSNYDVKEVSTLLDLSSSEVYQMIRRGEIQTFRCGRQLRVPREELENWLKDLKKDIKQHKER